MIIRAIAKRLLPAFEARLLARRLLNLPRDCFEGFTGRRNPLVPPHGLWYVGGEEDYRKVNEEYLQYFVSFGGLLPYHRVLDIGCGIGVMASRLTGFLLPNASYSGFDVVRVGVEWAQKHIGSRFSNFCFTHADIYNKHYNPRGRLSPDAFRFPFEDASFDFVFLKSVFTHMLPSSIQHYLTEIRRVLKPNGHCLSTQFLLNEQSLALITQGRSSLAMKPYSDGCYVVDPEFPETAVGIFESSFLEWCRAASLKVSPPIHYGSWGGRVDYTSYQDIVVSTPEAATELN